MTTTFGFGPIFSLGLGASQIAAPQRGRWGTVAARHHCATAAAAVRRAGLRHAAAPHRFVESPGLVASRARGAAAGPRRN